MYVNKYFKFLNGSNNAKNSKKPQNISQIILKRFCMFGQNVNKLRKFKSPLQPVVYRQRQLITSFPQYQIYFIQNIGWSCHKDPEQFIRIIKILENVKFKYRSFGIFFLA